MPDDGDRSPRPPGPGYYLRAIAAGEGIAIIVMLVVLTRIAAAVTHALWVVLVAGFFTVALVLYAVVMIRRN